MRQERVNAQIKRTQTSWIKTQSQCAVVICGPKPTHRVLRFLINRPVVMVSAVNGSEPQDTCSRWSKRKNKQFQVPRAAVVAEFNINMGGICKIACSACTKCPEATRSGLLYHASLH